MFEKGREEELYVKDCIQKAREEGCPYEEMAVLYRDQFRSQISGRNPYGISDPLPDAGQVCRIFLNTGSPEI